MEVIAMKRATVAVLFILLMASCAARPVKVTYLACEGFLIESGSKKVLIDGLFDDETINYCHLHSAETQAKLRRAEPPFDDIDLILVTHGHRDHFSADPVLEHMAANPDSIFIGPHQAVKQFGEERPDRIVEVYLAPFESRELGFSGIGIQAHRLHHSEYMVKDPTTGEEVNRHRDVENLAYLIEVYGIRVLHVGDAVLPPNREHLESEGFPKGKIDLVFLEFFDWSEETVEILESMEPDHIVFMHLPPQPEQIEQYASHLAQKFPNAVVFREPLESSLFLHSP
jgi:L-ascorbate metabolism protein UlaG (beta-lactamase superfamily)